MKKNSVYTEELEDIIDDIYELIDYITYESGDLDRGARETRKLFRKQINCLQGFETPEFENELKKLSSYISEKVSKGIVAGFFNTYNRFLITNSYIESEILPYIARYVLDNIDIDEYIEKTLKLRRGMSVKEFNSKTSNMDILYNKILKDFYLPFIKEEANKDGLIYNEKKIDKDILLEDIKDLVDCNFDLEEDREYFTTKE